MTHFGAFARSTVAVTAWPRHERRMPSTEDMPRRGYWTFLNSSFGLWFLSTCVVGAITFAYNAKIDREKAAHAATERSAAFMTTLLPHLTSGDAKKTRLAIAVAHYLKEHGELPGELESVLVQIVSENESSGAPVDLATREAAAAVIDIPLPEQPKSASVDVAKLAAPLAAVAALPARVYLQIGDESQRPVARALQDRLRDAQFIVPGIENVGAKAPKLPEVRYFRDEDRADAVRIVQAMKDGGIANVREPQLTPSKPGTVRPRHYEVWLQSSG
jgi:hypothetical protein